MPHYLILSSPSLRRWQDTHYKYYKLTDQRFCSYLYIDIELLGHGDRHMTRLHLKSIPTLGIICSHGGLGVAIIDYSDTEIRRKKLAM